MQGRKHGEANCRGGGASLHTWFVHNRLGPILQSFKKLTSVLLNALKISENSENVEFWDTSVYNENKPTSLEPLILQESSSKP